MAIRLEPEAPLGAPAMCEALQNHGIHARAYFAGRYRPRALARSGPAPVADAAAGAIVCLPFWGGLTEADVSRVVDSLARIAAGRRGAHRASAVQPAGQPPALVSDGAPGVGSPRGRP
jgi:dTDP-4-amino-4,6-dideoxygalactose transaminase